MGLTVGLVADRDNRGTRPRRVAFQLGAARFWRRCGRASVGLAALTVVTACGAFLPQSGPTTRDILSDDPRQTIDYVVAELDVIAVEATRPSAAPPFDFDFRTAGIESTGTIGIGDVLTVSVWENVEDGLLTSLGSKQSIIPDVLVDESGDIMLPYVGRIRAAGRTSSQLNAAIKDELGEQTLDPQVTVTRTEPNSRAVSVQGKVAAPGIYPLILHNDRLVPILAAAGGVDGEPGMTRVTVRRGDASSSGWVDTIYNDPSANIALRSGDIIIVNGRDLYFNAFGSVNRSGRQELLRRDLTLLDAISQVGGLNAQNADPTGVFIFRREQTGVASRLTRDGEGGDADDDVALAQLRGDSTSVVYQLQLTRPEAMFLASEFIVRDGDTIYVTEAPYAAWRKVLSVIVPTLGTAGSVNALSQSVAN